MQASRGNRFDLLRLAAALGVFAAHADFLYRLHLPVPFSGHSLGSLAVYIFFFISGYLICQSWAREPVWKAFWLKRAMRIFPGLVVAVAFSVFAIGWAVTTLSASDYLRSPQTWTNLANNAVALATVQTLPGVFEHNPFARAVNGSLWTIRYELAMYLALAMLAWAGRSRRWVYPAAACTLALLWAVSQARGWDAAIEARAGLLEQVFRWRDFCGFGVSFFLGSTLAAYAIHPRAWMAGAALAAAGCAASTDSALLRQLAVWVLIAWGTFYVAHAGHPAAAPADRERIDLSYGIYIYAFPVQQAMTELCLRHGWSLGVCVLLSLGAVLPLALLSWFAVERPCIRLARRWRHAGRQRAEALMPAASS